MKLYKIPCWLRNGDVYRNFVEEKGSKVPKEYLNFKDTSEINSIEDFEEVYRLSGYWGLYRYPLDIYVYSFLNKKEVIEYLKSLETAESKELIKDIEKKKSLKKYKNFIIEEFDDPKISEELNDDLISFIDQNDFLKTSLQIALELNKLNLKKIKSIEDLSEKITNIFLKNGARIHEDNNALYKDVLMSSFYIHDNLKNVYAGYYGTLGNLIEKFFEKNSENIKIAVGYVSYISGFEGYISIGLKKINETEDGDFEDPNEVQMEIKDTMEKFLKKESRSNKGSILLY